MKEPPDIRLDGDAERVRRGHADAIRELQRLPLAGAVVLSDIALADGVATVIPHGVGHRPLLVVPSAPRGATATGRIVEVRDGIDRTRAIKLTATGWGATITVDVLVV